MRMLAFLLIVLSTPVQLSVAAQNTARGSRNWETEQLENVHINTQGITSFFAELSRKYEIPIGLETATNEYEHHRYSIDFKKGTLAELLTQFVNQNSLYDWRVDDGVVNVFPKEGYRDLVSRELLATKIKKFSVKGNLSIWDLLGSLASQPESKQVLDANKATYNRRTPSGFYIPTVGRTFKLDVSGVTVKAILNNVVGNSATAKLWVISCSDEKTILIHLTSKHEDAQIKTNDILPSHWP